MFPLGDRIVNISIVDVQEEEIIISPCNSRFWAVIVQHRLTGENPRPFARYNNSQVKGPESTVTRRNNDFFLLHIDNGYVYYSVAKWEDCGISICEGNTLFTFLRTSHNDALRTSGRGKWI